ncbi:glutamate 5-kinase [Francisella sp. 19X1-34]|uniref:glutamate 5-kinase n=1 Tax=Francisella sp. 19X1-34 TaxID=3087177 RepID=UPI002E34EA0E|nr:glutamate 5-kinase [Francisella sp. 19X1-34]MED7789338.1 glutamate 5-kinase [Francisella sp. 19X1-34]
MQRKDLLKVVKRVVVKVGTSTLTHQTGLLNIYRIEKLVRQLADLHNQGFEIILVTSGAVGAGMGKLGLQQRPKTLPEKQAIAAVGQVALIHLYQKLFSEYGKNIAQLLLTKDDIANRERYLNARNAFSALLAKGVIPIVNENDAVVIDEIKVGDNDTLSALVANLIDADLLVLLSDIDGLYTVNPHMDSSAKLLNIILEISDDIRAMAGDVGSKFGTGGMVSKIKAAEIAVAGGVNMIIANGEDPKILLGIVSGEDIGTLFAKNNKKGITAKKHWITYSSHKRGEVVIDQGAVIALRQKKSLLPCGIALISGDFQKGATVSISDTNQQEIATGLVNYSSQDLAKIKGCKSSEIANILGYRDYNEVIHVDNMFLKEH